MKRSYIILLVFALQACHKYVYLTSSKEHMVPEGIPLKIDNSYDYYLRKVYRSDSAGYKKLSVSDGQDTQNKLIEIEHLFYSKDSGRIIYFSTIPDKYQNYYDSNFLGNTLVNVYDIRTLYFGKLQNRNAIFKFKNDITEDIWTINREDNRLNILTITEQKEDKFIDYIPLKFALEKQVHFKKVPGYEIVYHNFKDSIYKTSNSFPRLLNNTLYISTVNPSAKKKKYVVYFQFDKPIKDTLNQLYFPDKRIPYDPVISLENKKN